MTSAAITSMSVSMTSVVVVAALLGCGSTASSSRSPGSAPSSADPIIAVATAPPSSCGDAPSCEAECSAGSAAACTRVADGKSATEPAEARAIYQTACAAHDPAACATLAEISGADLEAAERYHRLACGAGDGASCAFLSEVSLVAFAAPRLGEDAAALLAFSEQTAVRACELGSYEGCFNAVTLLVHRKANKASIEPLAARALMLAEVACFERRLGACKEIAAWADKTGDKEGAQAAYIGQCEMERWVAPEGTAVEKIASCALAAELGDGIEAIAAMTSAVPVARAGREVLVSNQAIEAARIAGEVKIQPSAEESDEIKKGRGEAASVLRVCISKRGAVRSVAFLQPSPLAAWNRKLFEAARAWRFRSIQVEGEPTAVCTTATFFFLAR